MSETGQYLAHLCLALWPFAFGFFTCWMIGALRKLRTAEMRNMHLVVDGTSTLSITAKEGMRGPRIIGNTFERCYPVVRQSSVGLGHGEEN